MNNSQTIAKTGEDLAGKYLEKKNYRILGRNVKYREGEIDLIAQDSSPAQRAVAPGAKLVFVEVKTRTSQKFGYPEQSFDFRKKERFKAAILRYIYESDYQGDWRADLIAIELKNRKAFLRHYQSVELDD